MLQNSVIICQSLDGILVCLLLEVRHAAFWARADIGAHALAAKKSFQYQIEIIKAQGEGGITRHRIIQVIGIVCPSEWTFGFKQWLITTSCP